jgi:hypothetical protein
MIVGCFLVVLVLVLVLVLERNGSEAETQMGLMRPTH